METTELLQKVRKIEIKTRGLSNQIFSGEYSSAFKGRGMAFSEVRDYMPGDPIRTIDWNVTARFNTPFVKVFEEERELTVMLVIDISGSESYGSDELKKNIITELSAILAFSAITNNDKIGVILFTDQVEKFIPPKKGKSHILRIIRELLEFEPEHKGTNIGEALRYLSSVIKKRATTFVISDFIDKQFEAPLKLANKKHDLVALHIQDAMEEEIPSVGLLPIADNETGEVRWVDTSSASFQRAQKVARIARSKDLNDIFRRSGVDFATINTGQSYVQPLMKLFKKREGK